MTIPKIVASSVFISTGEVSGDLYAGFLTRYIKAQSKKTKIYGVGGAHISRAGVDVVFDIKKLMAFGFTATFRALQRNYRIYKLIARSIYRLRPDVFIAVAYPGMNLLLCRFAHNQGCRVDYFLPPQIWAWASFRKYFIKKWVDRVISVFPFEYAFYKKLGINTTYVKNPLISELSKYSRNDFKKRIGFMPGSRPSEIKRNLPIMIRLMKRIEQHKRHIEYVLIQDSYSADTEHIMAQSNISFAVKMIHQERYQTMKNCDLLIVCSGTASLEAAFMQIPQLFFNYPSFLDYYFTRYLIKTKEYNLVNLYFGRKIVGSIVSRNKRRIQQTLMRQVEKIFPDRKK